MSSSDYHSCYCFYVGMKMIVLLYDTWEVFRYLVIPHLSSSQRSHTQSLLLTAVAANNALSAINRTPRNTNNCRIMYLCLLDHWCKEPLTTQAANITDKRQRSWQITMERRITGVGRGNPNRFLDSYRVSPSWHLAETSQTLIGVHSSIGGSLWGLCYSRSGGRW